MFIDVYCRQVWALHDSIVAKATGCCLAKSDSPLDTEAVQKERKDYAGERD